MAQFTCTRSTIYCYFSSAASNPVYKLSGLGNWRRIAVTTQAGTTLLLPFPRKLYVCAVSKLVVGSSGNFLVTLYRAVAGYHDSLLPLFSAYGLSQQVVTDNIYSKRICTLYEVKWYKTHQMFALPSLIKRGS